MPKQVARVPWLLHIEDGEDGREVPRRPRRTPRGPEEDPEMARRRPKWAPRRASRAQTGPQEGLKRASSRRLQRASKAFSMLPGGLRQTLRKPTKGPKKFPGDGPKGSQIAQEAAKRAGPGLQDGREGRKTVQEAPNTAEEDPKRTVRGAQQGELEEASRAAPTRWARRLRTCPQETPSQHATSSQRVSGSPWEYPKGIQKPPRRPPRRAPRNSPLPLPSGAVPCRAK